MIGGVACTPDTDNAEVRVRFTVRRTAGQKDRETTGGVRREEGASGWSVDIVGYSNFYTLALTGGI
jgi:hypothetical protein